MTSREERYRVGIMFSGPLALLVFSTYILGFILVGFCGLKEKENMPFLCQQDTGLFVLDKF